MFNMKDNFIEFINDFFDDVLSSSFEIMAQFLFTHNGLTGFFEDVYNVFLGFGSIVLPLIILFKIIQHITQASANGMPLSVGLTQIIYRAFLASFLTMMFPFILMWLVGQVVYPLAEWMFGRMGSHTADSVTNILQSGTIGEFIGQEFMFLILFGFVTVAMVAFIIKICIYHADLMILTVFSVWAAVSIAADENNYASVWWREVLSQVVSIIIQIMLMVGVTEILATNNLAWYQFALLIGCCVLIIRGPSLTRSMWYATGSGRATMNTLGSAGRTATRLVMARGLAK